MKTKVLLFSALALAFSSMAQSENRESTDLVIIGAGGAGMSAAIEVHNQGVNVILLEKMPFAGGNTARAEGGLNAAGTPYQKAKGIEDNPELFFKDTMKGGRNINNPELVRILSEQVHIRIVIDQ